MKVTFVTGNEIKANHLAKYLGYPVDRAKAELEEIQSLDLDEIVVHKVKQAYEIVKGPVIVEDVSVVFKALGQLPGPFIKWFEGELGLEGLIKLLNGYDNRSAIATVTFGYYDGHKVELFRGIVRGEITKKLYDGPHDFGWNPIFRPEGFKKTYAELTDEEVEKFGLRPSTVYPQLKKFLADIDKN